MGHSLVSLGVPLSLVFLCWSVVCGQQRPGGHPGEPSTGDCGQFYWCNNTASAEQMPNRQVCFCDTLCALYGDCCLDAQGSSADLTKFLPVAAASRCKYIVESDIKYPVYVVESCPAGYENQYLSDKCSSAKKNISDVLSSVPVTDAMHGFTFRNMYCALCHGFSNNDFMFWDLNYTFTMNSAHTACPNNSMDGNDSEGSMFEQMSVAEMAKQHSCYYTLLPPVGVRPRQCFLDLVTSCEQDWTDDSVARQCAEAETQIVSFDDVTYRNQYCAACNYIYAYECRRARITPPFRQLPPPEGVPIIILLNFNIGTKKINDKEMKLGSQCLVGQIYDIYSESCKSLSCPEGFILQGRRCQPINSSSGQDALCSWTTLYHVEFDILPNGSLFIDANNVMISSGRYTVENETTLSVCAKDYIVREPRVTGRYEFSKSQGLLSLCGQIISILSLLLLLLVYSCFQSLRNVPGRCLMCLAASLASAQLLYVVGMYTTSIDGLCQAIAIIMHFSYLASFSWMNVMSFDIWKTFHQKFQVVATTPSSYDRRFAKYCIYPTVLPLAILTCCLVLEYSGISPTFKPRYGEYFCWINNKELLLYLFVLPAFLMVFINFVFFGMSVYHIYQASSGTDVLQKAQGRAKRRSVIIYAKLSTIMGLTWVFGFAASLTMSTVMWYLFIIFNSLQGLFIGVAFLCNRKVYSRISRHVFRRESATSASSTTHQKTVQRQLKNGTYKYKGSAFARQSTLQTASTL